jgi:hypothetical protein
MKNIKVKLAALFAAANVAACGAPNDTRPVFDASSGHAVRMSARADSESTNVPFLGSCTLDNNNVHTAYVEPNKTFIQTQVTVDQNNQGWVDQVDVVMPWTQDGKTSFEKVLISYNYWDDYQFTNVGSVLDKDRAAPVSPKALDAAALKIADYYRVYAVKHVGDIYNPCDAEDIKPELAEAIKFTQTFDGDNSGQAAQDTPDYQGGGLYSNSPIWIVVREREAAREPHHPSHQHQSKTKAGAKNPGPAPSK